MIDSHLAKLYEVATKNLNKAVARNKDRFPQDFMFKLTKEESDGLRFHSGTSKEGWGGRRYLPYAFRFRQLEMTIEKHDDEIQAIFDAIRQLMAPPPDTPKHPMGFQLDK